MQQNFSLLYDTTEMIPDRVDTCKDSILESARKGIFGNNSVVTTINLSGEIAGKFKDNVLPHVCSEKNNSY